MKKLFLASVAVIALVAGAASAADLTTKPVYKAPRSAVAPIAVLYNWSGFYIGGDVGWQGSRIGLSRADPLGSLTYAPHHDSFAFGGFLGAQRQFGQLVLGVEGGYLAANGQASLGSTPSISIFIPSGTGTAQAKLRDIWSAGGRIGWAIGNWMPYITGGYANSSFEFDAQTFAGSGHISEQARATAGGGYIGGGIDWALFNTWILGVEYRHYGFSTKTVTATQINAVGPPSTEPVAFAPSTDTIVARLSYMFHYGKAPLIARY
jgi:outer membrane immunogenic protein